MTLEKQSPLFQAFEVIFLSLIIGAVGYYVDPSDPLLAHANFSFMILWLAIITLFYGLNMGIIMWISFAIISFISYGQDEIFTSILLENLFFVFLYGFFFSNLHDEMDKFKIKTKYLQLRLKELTNAFFTLKISHDKLESIYITQPASFRFVISEILESSDHSTAEESASNTLRVLKKFFSVNSATIWRVKNDKPEHALAYVGDMNENIDANDRLIQEALTQKKAIYLNDLEDKELTSYLYAIPFMDKRDVIVSILIVKEIPFLFYHEDTLLKINVVFNYIWTEYKKHASLDKIREEKNEIISLKNDNHERQDIVDFKLEVYRLNNILNSFRIDSRIYVMATKEKHLHHEVDDFLYNNETLEILDQYIALECNGNYIHFILFPFVSNAAMYQKSKDLEFAIENKVKINKLYHDLQKQLSEENYAALEVKHSSVENFNALLEEFICV
jgi:hypothetical protein